MITWHTAIASVGILIWLFLAILLWYYLLTDFTVRFDNLKKFLSEDSFKLYYDLFQPSAERDHSKRLHQQFETTYNATYGIRRYIIPLTAFHIVSGFFIYLTTISLISGLELEGIEGLKLEGKFAPFNLIVISSILGAYTWVASDLIDRYRRRDFNWHDLNRCSFRFIIAVPIGYAFTRIATDSFAVPLAFFLGTFPTTTLFKFGRRYVVRSLDVGEQAEKDSYNLEKLQGIERTEAERFYDEGTTNIVSLAYSDPIDLAIRTNFDFRYLVDCIGQAIMWVYFGDDAPHMYTFGFRSAYEVMIFAEVLTHDDEELKKLSEKILDEMTRVVKRKRNTFKKNILELATDNYARFLFSIWYPDAEREERQDLDVIKLLKVSLS